VKGAASKSLCGGLYATLAGNCLRYGRGEGSREIDQYGQVVADGLQCT